MNVITQREGEDEESQVVIVKVINKTLLPSVMNYLVFASHGVPVS